MEMRVFRANVMWNTGSKEGENERGEGVGAGDRQTVEADVVGGLMIMVMAVMSGHDLSCSAMRKARRLGGPSLDYLFSMAGSTN